MGKMILVLFLPVFFCYTQNAFSQHGNVPSSNKKENAGKDLQLSAVTSVPQLLLFVENAKTTREKAGHYYAIIRNYLNRLKIDSALFYADRIKELGEAEGNEEIMGLYYLSISKAQYYRGKNTEANANIQKAIEIFKHYGNTSLLGSAYRQFARQLSGINESKIIVRKYFNLAAMHLTCKACEPELLALYYDMGMHFYKTYEADSVIFYALKSLVLAEKENNKLKIYNSSRLLGTIYLTANKLDDAGKYLKYALDVYTPQHGKVEQRNALAEYVEYLILKKDYAKAEESLVEYNKLNLQLGDKWGLVMDKQLRGLLAYQKEEYSLAGQLLSEAYKDINEMPTMLFYSKNIAYNLAKAELKLSKYDSAIVHLKTTRAIAKEIQFSLDEMQSNLLLAEAYQSKQQPDSAFYYFRQYSFLKDSVLTFQKEKTVMELTAKYDNEKKQQRIVQLQNEQQLFAYQIELKNRTIEKQLLLDAKKSQQLTLLMQQSEISRLQASEKNLELQNSEKEFIKKQKELELLKKEGQLQTAVAAKEGQQKKMLFVIIGAIALFAVYSYYRYRQNEKLRKQLAVSLSNLKAAQQQLVKTEREKQAEDIRVRISRDIHDEVGATLSGVALFSEIAKQKMAQHQEKDALEYLEHISVNSKEMVEKMSDIIWTINPKNDSFDRVIFKLQSYTMNLCAGKGIQLHVQTDEAFRSYSPSMQVRKNIYLLVKEAINNAVKYSGAKNLYFSMRNGNNLAKIEIRDDGSGFTREDGSGNGIHNMEARAKELDGLLQIDSQLGNGTAVKLQFNFHPIEVGA